MPGVKVDYLCVVSDNAFKKIIINHSVMYGCLFIVSCMLDLSCFN